MDFFAFDKTYVEKLRNGDEYDALTRKGRRSYKVFFKAGRAARTKRRFGNGVRKAARLRFG